MCVDVLLFPIIFTGTFSLSVTFNTVKSLLIYVYTSFLPPSFLRYLLIECEQQTADQCTAWGAGRAEADGDADGEGGGGMGR